MDFVLPYIKAAIHTKILDIQPIHRFGYYSGYFFSFLQAFPAVLFRNYDYVILENPYLTIFSPIIKIRRKKIIAEFIDYYPANLLRLKSQKWFRYQVAKLICRIFHNFVDIITMESKTAASTLIRWGVPSSKFSIIPVGIDTWKMKPKPQKRGELRSGWGIKDKNVVIGYLGKMVDYYNLENILKAVNEIKNPNLHPFIVFVGDGPEKEKLQLLAKDFNLENVFVGKVPYAEISGYYSAMDIFIFPLNALAIKIGEIISIGLPLIVPKGMAEDWITDMKTGLIAENTSYRALKNALIRYFSLSPEHLKLIKLNQQKFAKTFLDVKIIAKKYLELLN